VPVIGTLVGAVGKPPVVCIPGTLEENAGVTPWDIVFIIIPLSEGVETLGGIIE
jgi:hypothetical protein